MLQLMDRPGAEMLAIIGRRRVGKTYLVKQVYGNQMVFDFTGTQYANRKNQLGKFAGKITEYNKSALPVQAPATWTAAFEMLKKYLLSLPDSPEKKVVFFDELPWIAGHRSGFLQEFGYWWNDWASHQHIVVVVCGSAASWMITKVLNNKGSLHNRVTRRINLKPFTLSETEAYLKSKKINLERYEIIQLYMAMGGIPHYLNEIQPGISAIQNINNIFLDKNGLLRNEFDNLYAALFENADNHIEVIKTLGQHIYGMTRQQIIEKTKFSDGGGLTKILDELERSDFIMALYPFGKGKKDIVYRLTDAYSLFYLKFILGKKAGADTGIYTNLSNDKYRVWRGYAFENVCLNHANALKAALGISGIQASLYSFVKKGWGEQDGFQIDLLIDRADNCINLCEMKFSPDTFRANAEFAQHLRRRRELFREATNTRKQLFNTVVTTFGIEKNEFALSQIDQTITMDALF